MAEKKQKKKKKIVDAHAVAHIKSTFNNTILNITDKQGNTLYWASAGGRWSHRHEWGCKSCGRGGFTGWS